MHPFTKIDDRHLRALREILGPDGVRRDEAALERYGRDETENLHFPPEVVALPRTPEEVSRVMALAHREHLPVTPRGAGTGLSGGALPVVGGIVLGVERLNRIREINTRDLTAEVESGVVTGVFQARVEEIGLCYPPDPASRDTCLLAGNLAEDSAGPRSCKYGSTRKYVLGLEAVLADGTLIRTGSRNRKDAAGYNLTQFLVGSEGTLAVITAAILRLIPKPRTKLTLLLPFRDLEAAAAAIETLFREGHDPAACELLEEGALNAVGKMLELPAELRGHKALIALELDGNDPDTLLEQATAIGELAERLGGGEAIASQDAAEQRRLWEIRSKVTEAVKESSVYKEVDAVVPRSKLADLVRAARTTARKHGLEAICFGHAGDGNLHVHLLCGNFSDDAWVERRTAAETELFRQVVALGGSVTGEHGIGWSQRAFLPFAVEPPVLELSRQLKNIFDPTGILNPDKIFLPPATV